jgi:hypothetical protein
VDSYAWSAGGTPSAGSQPTFSPAFLSVGPKRIDLEVCNGAGCDRDSATVLVVASVNAGFSCSPLKVEVGQDVACSADQAGQGTYAWSATPSGKPPGGSAVSFTTSFSSTGAKTISLQVCSASKCASESVAVTVEAGLRVTAFCNPSSLQGGGSVSCFAQVTGSDVSNLVYQWGVVGGFPSQGSEPTFTTRLQSPGTYVIALNLCNDTECASATATVFVTFSGSSIG